MFLVGVACGCRWCTAQAQPRTEKRVHREQTND
jgi:hypothetical protein